MKYRKKPGPEGSLLPDEVLAFQCPLPEGVALPEWGIRLLDRGQLFYDVWTKETWACRTKWERVERGDWIVRDASAFGRDAFTGKMDPAVFAATYEPVTP